MKIEKMRLEHIEKIAQIELEVFGIQSAKDTLMKELENKIATYFVATKEDEVIGYIGIWNLCGEADVINLAVVESMRRRGVGKKLLTTVLDFCKKEQISSLMLEVRKSNIGAQALYEKFGFLKIGERKNYYDGKEDAVLMKKNFLNEV